MNTQLAGNTPRNRMRLLYDFLIGSFATSALISGSE